VVRLDPVVEAAKSRRLARVGAAMLGTALLALAGVWLTADSDIEMPVSASRPADPLAGRRGGAADSAPAPRVAAAEPVHPFLDPPGAGTVAYLSGDLEQALAHFTAAVERHPQDADAISNLGQVLVKLGRAGDALAHFQKATSLVPGRWEYQFNLARALGLVGRWDEAIAGYREAQRLFPNDYVTTFNLALAHHKKGDAAAAVDEYQKAIALQPNEASFRMALAISYEKLQKPADAAAAYAEYLRLSPSAPDADKVRARIAQLTGVTAPPPQG
jgi:Flp pilus assembly protein TadD